MYKHPSPLLGPSKSPMHKFGKLIQVHVRTSTAAYRFTCYFKKAGLYFFALLRTCSGAWPVLNTVFKYMYWYLHKLHHLYVPVPGKFLQKNLPKNYGEACLQLMLNRWLVGPSHWHTDSQTLTKLLQPAARAQCVPASSTLVQRVFSQGGIILKPHFARLSDILLSKLVFLKRNNHSNMQWRVTLCDFWTFVNDSLISFWLTAVHCWLKPKQF